LLSVGSNVCLLLLYIDILGSSCTVEYETHFSIVCVCVCAAFGFSVFGATTCMLDNVRGKDKPMTNAIIGGFIGGFCAGTRGKCF